MRLFSRFEIIPVLFHHAVRFRDSRGMHLIRDFHDSKYIFLITFVNSNLLFLHTWRKYLFCVL